MLNQKGSTAKGGNSAAKNEKKASAKKGGGKGGAQGDDGSYAADEKEAEAIRKLKLSDEKLAELMRKRIRNLFGYLPGKQDPVGMTQGYVKNAAPQHFNGVAERTTYFVVVYKPGYAFSFESVTTGGPNSITHSRSVVPPQLERGQFLVTMSWTTKKQSDLDLFVLVPSETMKEKKLETEAGGLKTANAAKRTPIWWSNTGATDAYPWANLDVDDMDGEGPETISVLKSLPGEYKVFVDCYSCSDGQNDKGAGRNKSFRQFYQGGVVVRIFDFQGLVGDFAIKDADLSKSNGQPTKYWEVATRTCKPSTSSKPEDQQCSVKVLNKFTGKQPT